MSRLTAFDPQSIAYAKGPEKRKRKVRATVIDDGSETVRDIIRAFGGKEIEIDTEVEAPPIGAVHP